MASILCIEDEPEIRESIAEELVDSGFQVIEANNGKEGLDLLLKHEPDLVLCDINMPVMDGHELLRVLRRDHPDLVEVPFIFLSANADRSHIIAGKKLGADDYLTKPIDFDVLVATVKSRLNQIFRIKDKHEKQLLHTQKMEAVGRLTCGITHEFNNMLTAIRGFSEIAARNTDNQKLVSSCLAECIEISDRASSITSQLLAYSRKQISETVRVDANSVVDDVVRLLQPVLGPKMALRQALAEEQLPCEIDPSQFTQVLVNMAINARDAMPNGGEIVIATSRQMITEEIALNLPENIPAGKYVCFSISDNGTGIDEATLSKIYEPFFTTKEEGEGTGLGLAVAYGIVRQSHGIIDCESVPGEGTIFRVYVPEAVGAAVAASKTCQNDSDKTKTILVVDDEEIIRNVVKTVLEEYGYRVLTASDSESALSVAGRESDDIDLLLCDIMLPTTDGPDLVRELGQSRRHIETIFMTGNIMAMDRDYPDLKDTHVYLEKPFTASELEKVVSEVFAGG